MINRKPVFQNVKSIVPKTSIVVYTPGGTAKPYTDIIVLQENEYKIVFVNKQNGEKITSTLPYHLIQPEGAEDV